MRVPVATTSRTKTPSWKGKERETVVEREGSGGSNGVVLPLQLLTESMYQSVYTLPVLVGGGRQNLSLQVDTGSADLWIASTSCSSSPCSGTGGHLYDPSTATAADDSFALSYLRGSVSGDIVWDAVSLGGYNITNQALAAVSSVDGEPLDPLYSGILGLALPADSSIYLSIGNDEGNALAANLFGMTSSASAPSAPFLSLSLGRPGFNDVPSVLGVGLHPSELVPDPSKVEYRDLVTNYNYDQFWATSVRDITVWVDGKAKVIALGDSTSGATYPTAVLDSGTPVILASPVIASGIYAALGMTAASDGTYYIPCTTPINMTITLDDRTQIPLHPLDLSTSSSTAGSYCMGMIQSTAQMTSSVHVPDVVLGVPFLRSVYMVMAYENPDEGGTFSSDDTYQHAGEQANPQLGLMALTNATQAIKEFNQTRLGGGASGSSTGSGSGTHGKKLSVGIDVLLGCVGFLVLCAVIFVARWLYYKRKWRRVPGDFESDNKDLPDVRYTLARHSSMTDRYSMADSSKSPPRRPTPLRNASSYYGEADALGFLSSMPNGATERTGERRHDEGPARASVASWDSFCMSQTKPSGSPYAYQRAGLDSPPGSPGLPLPEGGRGSVVSGDASSPAASHRRLESDESLAVPLLAHTRTPSSGGGVARSEDLADYGLHLRPQAPTRRPGYERMTSFTSADLDSAQRSGVVGEDQDAGEHRDAHPVFSQQRVESDHSCSELDRTLPPSCVTES
ncbi:aspartic peptidase domain-containing protein [Fomitopsis serialis]|uniref:aspartic peptidase domain-containing protein n=1 Tax=Fomitopsis serialis TaxID=139415 RepID=UPI0020074DC9|nr:aspartic peptidase domain-containing protein [Neoantrodia serialis]KAH9915095.1 aspartic peptidase domain-containing protein [Neoantrodia serialis]